MSILEYYKKNFLNIDPLFAFLIAVAIFYFNLGNMFMGEFKSDFYISVSTIGGTLLGFIITTLTIILNFVTAQELKELENAKNTKKDIFKTYISTMKWLTSLTVISLIILILPNFSNIILSFLSIFIGIVVILRLFWCFWILENLVKIIYLK
ncbi:MAG: hypothetical protein LBV53_01125 [Mycoplasmataceae bacterium]|jgi:hypothetical protein|nr:hypothetical protein [Mycoplasmataceae bacterium]